MTEQGGQGGGRSTALARPTRWQVAVHEAAHAVYAHSQGLGVSGVDISGIVAVEDGRASGGRLLLGRCHTNFDGEHAGARQGRLGCVLSLVGIPAAQRAGRSKALLPWAGFVRRAGQGIAGPLLWDPETVERLFMDAGLVSDLSDEERVLLAAHLAEDPESFYEAARAEAEAFVGAHWEKIVGLAERLVDEESLDSTGVSAVLGPGWDEFRELLDELADDRLPWMKALDENAEGDGWPYK